MAGFNECTRVQVPAALHLCRLGYTYFAECGEETPVGRLDKNNNVLTDEFLKALVRLNPEQKLHDLQIFAKFALSKLGSDDLGREFYQVLSSNSGIKLIDFENPENNSWLVTTELPCENQETGDSFRPDITCFVNGLPLAFIEVKKPNNAEGIVAEQSRTNQKRLPNKSFRRFLNITQLMIFSNNQEYDNANRVPVQGAFYACIGKQKAFFNVFREEDEKFGPKYPYREVSEDTEKLILKHRNCLSLKCHPEYATNCKVTTPTNRILTSLLSKERFLFLLRYGFAYVEKTVEKDDGEKIKTLEKHVMRYQQLFASFAIRKKLDEGVKSGIIWHTQGSGKTALAYYSVKSLTDYFAKKSIPAKFYFIVDRIDLMEQACDEFAARGLVVQTVEDRAQLMADIKNTQLVKSADGRLEITVVNIQKFAEDKAPVDISAGYNTNLQRIFFIDEAHRGYNPEGAFLANLLGADKHAIKLALTGTPLLREERESWRVFGDYIHTYYYDKSIADGYTLKLMREPIETHYKETLQGILDELENNSANQIQVKKSDIDKDKIIEHPKYLNALLDYIIDDFTSFRVECDDKSIGAMIVCKTNDQARKLFELWNERYDFALSVIEKKREEVANMAAEKLMHYNASFFEKPLKASLILHDEGDKKERKEYIVDYKKNMTTDFLIVNKMLLTGFDANRLKKLYLGRKLDGHDLLQALTRVNRPYKDFKYGYVVDFVDIKENFDATNDRYLRELNKTTEDSGLELSADPGQVIIENPEEVKQQIKELTDFLWNFPTENYEEFREVIDEIEDKEPLYHLRKILEDAKGLGNRIRSSGNVELQDKYKNMLPGGIPVLLREVERRIAAINFKEGNDHSEDVSGIINTILDSLDFEFRKGISEELKIIINSLREEAEKVRAEFDANFDKKEDKFVNLIEEFKKYFREHGYIPKDKTEAEGSIFYLKDVMSKIKEINRKNRALKSHYKDDEKFVRIHKRIVEANEVRAQSDKKERPLLSKEEFEIQKSLIEIKDSADDLFEKNPGIVENEDKLRKDILGCVSHKFMDLDLTASLDDRKFISNLISNEYINQYNSYGV